jgi:hypothetical protein
MPKASIKVVDGSSRSEHLPQISPLGRSQCLPSSRDPLKRACKEQAKNRRQGVALAARDSPATPFNSRPCRQGVFPAKPLGFGLLWARSSPPMRRSRLPTRLGRLLTASITNLFWPHDHAWCVAYYGFLSRRRPPTRPRTNPRIGFFRPLALAAARLSWGLIFKLRAFPRACAFKGPPRAVPPVGQGRADEFAVHRL